jgi:hypothetical protein
VSATAFALRYAAKGIPVLPCRGKLPLTAHGVHDATTDPDVIAKWPEGCNVGIATGHGLVVLDVDPRHGGDDALHELEREHGELPATASVVTGGGGQHYYFAANGLGNSTGKLGHGLDLKGEGGYVIAPPSLHESGRRYEWDEQAEPVPLPGWIRERLTATNGAAPLPDVIPEGKRNAALASLAGSMRRRGASRDAMLSALRVENAERCQPPLRDDELARIAESVGRYEPAPPPPSPAPDNGPADVLRNPDPSLARPVRWAWRHRVAIGKLNLLVGNEGTGKGVVNAWQAGMLSHGRLEGDLKGQPVNVLIVGDEDALDDTWTPRLYAVEANWRRVFFPPQDIGDLDVTTEDGLATLAGWVSEYGIAVVVFDALLDNLGSADVYEPRQVRSALRPLRRFAADAGVAVLGSLHPRKGDALNFRDLVAGSHQFNAVSRSSLLIAEHPDDPRRRVVLRGKGNLSVLPDPLEFEIKSCTFQLNGTVFDQPIATDWETAEIELDDVLPRRSRESKQESAGHWLRAYLGGGDWQASAEVKEAGSRAGFNERMLKRAMEALVEDREAQIRNTDTVPRRTEWRLGLAPHPSRDNSLPPIVPTGRPRIGKPKNAPSRDSRDSWDNPRGT